MIRPLVLGGMVYGDRFLDILETWCVPTLRAPENLKALQGNGAKVMLYTDAASRPRLEAILALLDLPSVVHVLPDNLPKGTVYDTLAAVQAVSLRSASEAGYAYHMLMPDQSYSAAYFPGLLEFAARVGDVVHSGLNVNASAGPEFNRYRQSDGALVVPAKDMGEISSRHVHNRLTAYLMNKSTFPDSMPLKHFQFWRAQDRLMYFCVHNNPAYLSPEGATRMPQIVTGTLDTQAQYIVGGDFRAPSLAWDMTYIGIEHADTAAEIPFRPWELFAASAWKDLTNNPDLLSYVRRPTMECAAPFDASMPTAEEVRKRQAWIADELMKFRMPDEDLLELLDRHEALNRSDRPEWVL